MSGWNKIKPAVIEITRTDIPKSLFFARKAISANCARIEGCMEIRPMYNHLLA
ncbi:hypothetical protein ES703_77164 [subsurface metagenome]